MCSACEEAVQGVPVQFPVARSPRDIRSGPFTPSTASSAGHAAQCSDMCRQDSTPTRRRSSLSSPSFCCMRVAVSTSVASLTRCGSGASDGHSPFLGSMLACSMGRHQAQHQQPPQHLSSLGMLNSDHTALAHLVHHSQACVSNL